MPLSEDWDAWLRLLRAPGIGPVSFGKLLQRFGTPQQALRADRQALEALGIKRPAIDWLRQADARQLEADRAWLSGPDNHLVTRHDPDYPALLADIADAPPVLFVTGDPAALTRPQLAIVGSRNPTSGGLRTAQEFASFLAASGLTITSGLAIGIDAAAHQGALEHGLSIAVCGTGPDRIYPAGNRALAHRIAATGALVSEFPPGTGARRENFPRRNRIISGLSLGTLVVEAAARSGSLITARMAGEQGREVFAIPGSIHNPLSRGCHALIRQGAKLVETANDIIEELMPLLGNLRTEVASAISGNEDNSAPAALDADYHKLLDCLGHDPMAPDALMQCSGFPADVISSMLLMLELEGYISCVPGGRYSRTAKAIAPNP
jgi:DNA processing protein